MSVSEAGPEIGKETWETESTPRVTSRGRASRGANARMTGREETHRTIIQEGLPSRHQEESLEVAKGGGTGTKH